ncbi:MAG: sporulation initiation factor Spo0A C-terminal domain-containing protein [Lachnospiraceae bacterium]
MRKMNILLIEDDLEHCYEYRNEILSNNIHVLHTVHGCNAAFDILDSQVIDIILLDLELHNADSDGIFFLQQFRKIEFKYRKPFIIVITANTSINTHSIARKFGADYIITKSKIDYSPKFVIDFAYTFFLASDNVVKVPTHQSEDEVKRIVVTYLEKIGITNTLDGWSYLIDSIYIAAKLDKVNLSKDVYPKLARKYKKRTYSIQKAISTAIEKAWRVTDWNILADNYTVEVNYLSSMPSNKEFICYYAEKLRHDNLIMP